MNLFGFFRRRKQFQIIQRDETKISLQEWRSDMELAKLARKVWANPDFRLMVACLRNESPANLVLPDDALPHRSVALQRRQEGYLMAIANLEAMAEHSQPVEQLESTYGEPEKEQ